jgi:putative aldouronate transport system substrate-binding protein
MITNFGVEGVDYDMIDGFPTIKQEIVDRNINASDVFMAIQGEIGVGLHGMGQYIDESTYKQVSDPLFVDMGKRIQEWTDEGTTVFLPNWPSFTADETEEITDLELRIGNVFNQEIDAYITGKKSMDQWSELVDALKAQGTERLEEIFNQAYDRIR